MNIGPLGAWGARVSALLLAALALPAAAQVLTINQIDFPASIGRASDLAVASTPLDATVQVRYLRQLSASAVVRVSLPSVLQVAPPALPQGCTLSTVAGVVGVDCTVAAGSVGSSGTLSFPVRGRQLGGLSMTATAGTSSATRGGSVITAGNIGHLLTQDAAGPYAAGASIAMSWRPTLDAAADDLPAQAVILLSDRLPGTTTDFTLQAIDLSEAPGVSCDSVAQAQSSRTLTCRVSGPLTRAALGALRIRFSGTAGTSGSFVHQATAALQDGSPYLDAQPDDNVVTSAYTVDPAADLQAAIAFTSNPVLAASTQSLTLTLSNNGPMTMPAGAQISLPLAAGFTVTSLPTGCTGVVSGQTLGAATTLRCSAASLTQGGTQSWNVGLRMPSAAGTGTWTATATPAAGWRDANAANDVASTLYTVTGAFADLGLSKSKLPLYGPVVPGTVVTTTITVRNESSSTAAATYTAAGGAQPLRVVDYLLPAEIDAAVGDNGLSAVSDGWTCAVSTASDPANAARTRRIVCQRTAAGTLAPGQSLTLSFSTRVSATMDGAPLLENRACTGETALAVLGLGAADGPQPPGNGQTSNDCAIAGGYLRATTATTGRARVEFRQWSSTVAPVAGQETATSADWHDDVADPAVLAGEQSTLYWRFELATPSASPQVTIPTLLIYNGNLPGLLNVSSPGAPAPGYVTPAITVTRELLSGSATLTGCPTTITGTSGQLVCTLTQVAPGTRLRLTLAVPRPLAAGLLSNTMAWVTSPDAFLTAVPGKVVDDDAAVQVLPRTDLALTSLSMAPTQPRIGQTVQFVATAQNLGPDEVAAAGAFTVIDDFNVDTAGGQAAYGDLVASAEGMSCSVASTAAAGEPALAAGHRRVRCTNTSAVARYATRTVTVSARLLKPAGSLPASGAAWTAQGHTARVVLGGGLCEFKQETSTSSAVSTTCGDTASQANNAASLQYDVGLPQIDLILGTQLVLPTGQSMPAIGQPLRYRFVLQNNGPSRAEGVTLQARLTLPAGFSVSSPTVAAVNAQAVGAARYVLDTTKNGQVSCSMADATLLSCRLAPQAADAWLAAGAEVNFEVELASTGSALVPVTYSQASVVCADESLAGYESSGNCSLSATADNNNRAAVNDIVFPSTDLAITKSQVAGGSPASLNEPLAWDLGLRNRGPQPSTQMRVTDVLPAGFEWLQDSAHAAALTLGSAVGTTPTLACSASPAALSAVTEQQTVSCVISAPGGGAMAVGDDAAHQLTLRLWARRRADWLQGPYGSAQLNTASVAPGVDASGTPLAVDAVGGNDTASASVVLQRASLAGRVVLDRNGNGVVDGSGSTADGPIEGVTITLRGTDSWGATFSRSVSTAADGSWQFDHLPPGVYSVEETQPAGLVDSPVLPAAPAGSAAVAVAADSAAGTGTRWTALTLAGGQSVSGLLFTDTDAAASLAGRVWRDLDADGVQDGDAAGETGVAGVAITLQRVLADGTTTVAGTATTGADGRWSITGLTAGSYRVLEGALPDGSGLLDGRAVAGKVAGAATGTVTTGEPNRIDAVALAASQAGSGYDFAEVPAAAISGRVWLDANGDGIVDATESGIGGVTLTLSGIDDRGQSVTRTVQTATDGRWSFSGLRPGTYAVVQSGQPDGTVNGVTRSAVAGALATNPAGGGSQITNLVLAAGQQAAGNLFGEQPSGASLAGRVWRDLDADGVQDGDAAGETGVAGVAITLQRVLADGTTTVAGTATTGADGRWSVTGLTAGTYRVVEGALPDGSGLLDGRAVAGQVAGAATGTVTTGEPNRIDAVTLTAGQAGSGYDFAEVPAAAISGRVWSDANGDGIVDATESGIGGVTLTLSGIDDRGQSVTRTVQTATDGRWSFSGLRPGTYAVVQSGQPDGTVNGVTRSAVAGALATNPAGGGSQITNLVLAAGQQATGNLFGEQPNGASLAGRVWRDLDADGVQDGDAAGETGVAGVVITLQRVLADGTTTAAGTATTGADGRWSITGLTAGSYRVLEGALPDGGGLLDGRAVAGQVAGTATGTVTTGEPNRIDAVTLTAGQAGSGYDFAEVPAAAISGRVWMDANGDGIVDATEAGIADSRVRLVGTDDRGIAVDLEVRTDAQGQWRFDGLRPGRYRVLQPQQPAGTTEGAIVAGAAATAAGAGGALNTDGQSEIGPLTLTAGASVDGLLFGERPAAPDLRVTATASTTTVTAGRTLTLTLTTANVGAVATSGSWSVSDLLPAGFTLAALPTGAGWTCDGSVGGRAFSCSRSDVLAAGATLAAPITVPVQVASTAVGTLRDAVLVAGGGEAAASAPTAAEQAALQTGGDPSTLTACTATPQHQACQLAITVRAPGAVSGTAWLDSGSVASRLDGTDVRLAGWAVELVDAGATVVARTTTASDGSWRIGDLEPGLPLQLRYREPASGVVFGWPVNGEQGTAQADCLADADALSQGRASACVRSAGQPWSRIVVAPGSELVQQSLPVSAGGVVYDSTTRQPVAGARVSFAPQGSCAGFDPASQMVGASLPGGAASGYTIDGQTISMLTGAQGLYQFQFLAGSGAPAQCTFGLSVQAAGYVSPSSAIPAESRTFAPVADDPAVVVAVQSQASAPVGSASTVWYATLAAGGAVATAVNNHLPLDPSATAVLTLAKTGDRSRAEVGDSVRYTITVQRGAGTRPTQTTVVDRLPAGFTYIRGSASVNGTRITDPAGGLGPVLSFQLGAMAASGSDADRLVLRYRVRVDTGALQGDGVNRAVAHGCAATASCVGADGRTPLSGASTSNEGRHTVAVGGGVFATEACLAGKVFVDCNHDHVQGAEELGIPGVRLILSDGTNLVSDVEGKYAVCGLAPRSHVLRVDETTLPRGSRLTTSSGRNLGDAGSLWLDLKYGELHRADVVEGSCSNTVLEQVKARRALGEVTAPQTERAGTRALRFDSKAHGLDAQRSPARGTDGANQRVRPRSVTPAAADAPSEAALPVSDLPMNRPPPRGRRTGDEPTSGDDDATR